ncbi:LuxR C-terminal-related transcriptional regulator, partial [Parvimonas sp. D4]|uniref:LuxR C-terminal-related transcriptional regulator n=1 Tax=Parvimonas sp. D4 TaxID=3110690 RepID=UPI002B478F4F
PGTILPRSMFYVAEIVGAAAIASARRLGGLLMTRPRPRLSERQRECVFWAARDKTAAETGALLGIGEQTVAHHLKIARERYDVASRQ